MATVSFEYGEARDLPDFGSFISLWTLSLAPLIAHVIAGVPQRTLLAEPEPTVLQKIVHWNPTSIMWRYFAIIDRRVRSKSWDKAALATTNALFWTERGWDGGEGVSSRNRLYLTRVPKKAHVGFLSASLPQTTIVTLQGVQALYQLLANSQNFATNLSSILPTLFLPLALFGLIRLPAAYWLTEEYAFADVRDGKLYDQSALVTDSTSSPATLTRANSNESQALTRSGVHSDQSTSRLQLGIFLEPVQDLSTEYYPPSNWRGVSMRILFLLLALGTVALSIYYVEMASQPDGGYSVTGLCMLVFYTFFTVVTAALFLVNIVRGASCTTVIPGIDSILYKLYTCALIMMAVAMFVVASLEQTKPSSESSGY